jgi:serine/threonine protein kinase
LAHYRVLHRLASAGQSEVFLALDTRLSRRGCIKLFHLHGGLSRRRRAVQEAWQLTRVEGPRTVEVYDVVASGRRLALVTRYVPGANLASLLQQQALPPANALAIASDLAAALAALRRARIVHGDLKPANVLIDPEGRAVLADFGIAVLQGEPIAGYSLEAVSPEQSREEPATLASDFFALGLLLYRMLFAAHPFYRDGELDLRLLRQGERKIPACPQLPENAAVAIQSLLLTLLAASPEDRPAGTFELREQLRAIRSMLPAPQIITPWILALSRQASPRDATGVLPRRLVKLPYTQQLAAWLRSYWAAGSVGARGLLLLSLLFPLLLSILLLASPGPCVSVSPPVVSALPPRNWGLPDEKTLREQLTTILKAAAGDALVLGAGPASDSRTIVSAVGARDVCVAERELALSVECAEERCLLRMRARRQDEMRERQLFVPHNSGLRVLLQSLSQLVDELLEFLLG